MTSILPNIISRTESPKNLYKSKSRKIPRFKKYLIGSIKKFSLTPTRKSIHTKALLELLEPRAVSDEVQSNALDKDPVFIKLTSSLVKSPKNSKFLISKHKQDQAELNKGCPEVIDAIFSIFKSEGLPLSATSLIELFASTGIGDPNQISEIFYNLSEGLPLNLIRFRKGDLVRICKDPKSQSILNTITRDTQDSNYKSFNLNSLLMTIKTWWNRLDKTQSGLVAFDSLIKFYADMRIIENTYDIKRIFVKVNQAANFKEFSSIFAKPLFYFLVLELGTVIQQGSLNYLPAEIAIATQRRKTIISSIKGNKLIGLITNYP